VGALAFSQFQPSSESRLADTADVLMLFPLIRLGSRILKLCAGSSNADQPVDGFGWACSLRKSVDLRYAVS
jgi:hypothetical protein